MAYRFTLYHPYLTYSDPLNTTHFVKPNGKHGKELNPSTDALFRIGKEAYKRLAQVESKEEFDNGILDYSESINAHRVQFQKANFKGKDSSGELFNVKWGDVHDNQMVDVIWQMFSTFQSDADAETKEAYAELFLFHALIAIDDALICIDLDSTDAVSAAIEAANSLANAMAVESGNDKLQEARRDMSFRGAMAKIANDPRQKEKAFVFECWQNWQKSPATYASKAAFSRDMIAKCEYLKSQKKIEDWCREWEKANPAG